MDERTPIIDIIGQREVMSTLATAAAELSVAAQKICRFVDGKNPPEGNPDRVSTEFHTSFNRLMLCAEYLGLQTENFIQMVEINHWHDTLAKCGLEDAEEKTQKKSAVLDKFKKASFMGG